MVMVRSSNSITFWSLRCLPVGGATVEGQRCLLTQASWPSNLCRHEETWPAQKKGDRHAPLDAH